MRVPRTGAVTAAAVASVGLAGAYLLSPVSGTDLSAQVARSLFVRDYGLRPVDFGWYAGVFPYGYSWLTGPLDALAGARVVGAAAAVVGAVAFGYLLARGGVHRPVLGGLLGAVSLVFDVVSGRMTFAVGLALGLLALCPLVWPVGRRAGIAVAGLALLSAAASPVAGVFTVIAGASLVLSGRRAGALLAAGAGLPLLLVASAFSDGGVSPFSAQQARTFVVLAVAVAVVVPRRHLALRIGSVLTAVGVLAGHVIASPLGGNTARLPLLFAVPLVVATADLPAWALPVLVAVMLWWQPPLVASDLTGAGARSTEAEFFAPLLDQLRRRHPSGRVEVVPLRDHWESAYVADVVPLARGWERQADVGRNPLFYVGRLTAAAYRRWLLDNAVALVAVARRERPDVAGERERALLTNGLPYLRRAWSSPDWQLYDVHGARPIVEPPGRLLASDRGGVTFATAAPGRLVVGLRYSRWVSLAGPAGACLRPRGRWTEVQVAGAGTYRVSSGWHLRPGRRC